jgi:uncharacterized protein YbaR (Trm112 family)
MAHLEGMVDPRLAEILVCPETRLPLVPADAETLARINRAIASGGVKTRSGRALSSPLAEAVVRRDGAVLYPVLDGIPALIVDEAIFLDQAP